MRLQAVMAWVVIGLHCVVSEAAFVDTVRDGMLQSSPLTHSLYKTSPLEVCVNSARAGLHADFGMHITPSLKLVRAYKIPVYDSGVCSLQRIVVAKAMEESSGGTVEKSIFINATPEECFRVATGYEVIDARYSMQT